MRLRLLLFLLAASGLPMMTVRASTFFVSPAGSNQNPGTLSRPFATLTRAQTAVRTARHIGPVTVNIREGIYSLSKPLVFSPADSGGPAKPIVYQAYHAERVVLSGAVPLKLSWRPYKNGIFQANLYAAGIAAPDIDQLFVNGALQRMARYPNYDPAAPIYHGTSADAIAPARVKTWTNPVGGYVHGLHAFHWGSLDYRITGHGADGALTMEGGWQNNRPASMHDSDRFVENIFEELDAPGEWYLDRGKGVLYLMPLSGVDLRTATVAGSVASALIELRGSQAVPVRNITFRGLEFTQTSRTFMETKEPLLRSDWRIYRGGVAFFEGAEDCAIQDCDFVDVGSNAVFVSGYNRRVDVTGCRIEGAGASGLCFVGKASAVRSPLFQYDESQPESAIDWTPGPKTDDYPAECIARDNLITRIGEIEKQAAGVEIDIARDITVSHCSIYNMPRSGINIGDGCWGGHVISDCDVFDTVKESGDHGSFNSWGRDRYWYPDRNVMNKVVADRPDWFKLDVVKPITLKNTRWVCRHGWDIDLDDGSSNYIITNNLCLGGGIKNREGGFRELKNNVLVNSTFHPHVWFEHSHDIFTHNIVMRPYQPISMPNVWGDMIDANLLADDQTLVDQRTAGRDQHSLAGDPKFINPAIGDYRVKPESPALTIGFVNFPMDHFGVTSPRLRARAFSGFDYAVATDSGHPTAAQALAPDVAHVWFGATVKSVTRLGEQSVAGLPEMRGVMVMHAPVDSHAFADGVRDLDVIWSVDGHPIGPFEELERQFAGKKSVHELGVYRNQKIIIIAIPQH